jgi:hypothetical protein
MGTSVFTWKVAYGEFVEGLESRHERAESQSGTEYVRAYGSPRFVVNSATMLFTDATAGESLEDWITFYETTISNGSDSFLYKAKTPAWMRIETESLGTHTNPNISNYTTTKKFLDLSTLTVFAGGVEQTLTTDYTVSGNNTAPTITTTATFDSGAVTATYEYYRQVRIVGGFEAAFMQKGTTLTATGAQTARITLRELTPGGSDA